MKLWILTVLGLSLSGAALVGCGGSGDEEEEDELPQVDCMATPPPTFANVSGFTVCQNCHNSALTDLALRQQASLEYNYDSYQAAVLGAQKGAEEVNEGAMPPPGTAYMLTPQQAAEIIAWAQCGTPM